MDSAYDPASRGGLPHSEISGLTPARGSPELIAACHVLHRLSVPRHPPNALIHFLPSRAPIRVRRGEPSFHEDSEHSQCFRLAYLTPSGALGTQDKSPIHNVKQRNLLLPPPALESGGAAKAGGGERDRTDDLLLAKQALSQLSYTPPENR